jgi:hypothetical protein
MHNFWTILIHGPRLLALHLTVVVLILLAPLIAYAAVLKQGPAMPPVTKQRAGIALLASAASFFGAYVLSSATTPYSAITVPSVLRVLQTVTDYQVVCRWNVEKTDQMTWSIARDRLLADDVKWRKSFTDMAPHARAGKDVPCGETPVAIDNNQIQADVHAVLVWMVAGKIMWLLGCAGIGWSLLTGLVNESRLSRLEPSASQDTHAG